MKEQIKKRTKQIGLAVIKLVSKLPNNTASWVIGKQIIRCSTSVGANYRASCRAKSTKDFINKLKIVEEEADETLFWLEMLEESNLCDSEPIKPIYQETNEILSIIVASIKTARKNQNQKS